VTDTTVPQTAYLTVADVATRLTVSKMTVYRMVKLGQLAGIRVGSGAGTIRISEAAYAEYLRARPSAAAPAAPAPVPLHPGQLGISHVTGAGDLF
jgi:excisionase family DNA binding protein